MSSELTDVLQQYGMDPSSARGSLLSGQLNGTSAPPPGTPTKDPAMGSGGIDGVGQALNYAKQLQGTFQGAVHSAAQVAAKAPGIVGLAGQTVAQATAPNPNQPVDAGFLQGLIKKHESSDNYSAVNPHSTASGAYQYTNGTWGGYGGYSRAALAPRAVQDQRAMQDIQANLSRYAGDPFKAIAAHYLPAAAQNPGAWSQPYRLPSGKTVAPVADYVRATVANTPLQGKFDAYLQHYAPGQG